MTQQHLLVEPRQYHDEGSKLLCFRGRGSTTVVEVKKSSIAKRLTQPARVGFRQNIRHSQKIYIFWKLFIYRFIIAIQNGPSWVLPISDFFKLLFSKLRNEEK